MKRKLAWMVVLAIFLSFTACAEELILPEKLKDISEEAFMGNARVTTVKMPDQLETIGARAFKDCASLEEVELPDSVISIGEDAFDSQVQISCGLDSYAYEYARQNGYVVNLTGNYVVLEGWKDYYYNRISATVSTTCACVLLVELLDENMEETLLNKTQELEGELQQQTVKVDMGEMPETFVLRLTLQDKYGNAISEPFVSLAYTSLYRTFESKSRYDYPEERVLDYWDSGFAVLDESVIIATGERSNGSYSVHSQTPLKAGDMLYIKNLNEVFRIGAVTQ